MDRTESVALAVRRGNAETAVPRLLAMFCVLAVFIPSFLMQGAPRALFAPLALAVGFAMVTSYLLSSTFVPVMCVWLLRHRRDAGPSKTGLFHQFVETTIRLRWLVLAGYLLVAAVILGLIAPRLGTEIFPQVDAGKFQFR